MKNLRYIRWAAVLLTLALGALLTGCARQQETPEASEATTLWVVTERSNSDGMNYQANVAIQRMEEKYENLTVRLDVLPTDQEDRETYLKQIRTQIMAGGGPDVYLLPTGSVLTMDYPLNGTKLRVEALFPDVQQAMYSGLFLDIQAYYTADTELGVESLKPEIMDAGCLGESRYVLPLRFDMPMVLTDEENWKASGMDPSVLQSGVDVLLEEVLTKDATATAVYALRLPNDLSILTQAFDYEKGELLLTQQQIADYMRLYQTWKAASAQAAQPIVEEWSEKMYQAIDPLWRDYWEYPTANLQGFNLISYYADYKLYWGTSGFPLYTETMEYLMDAALMSKRLGRELTIYPMRGTDGLSSAKVTYYGAVGSGCAQPELAYEFLRQFLTEEFQWDICRPRVEKTRDPWDREEPEPQRFVLVESSWPVRTVGSVEYLYDNRGYQMFSYAYTSRGRVLGILADTLTDEDLPILAEPIDTVRFPIAQDQEESLEYALSLLNDLDGNPTDVDIDALAEQMYLNLWWHLAEG